MLSEMQAKIYLLLTRGLSPKEVATKLGKSDSAVKSSMQHARRITGCKTTYELVAKVAVAEHKRKVAPEMKPVTIIGKVGDGENNQDVVGHISLFGPSTLGGVSSQCETDSDTSPIDNRR